MKNHISDWLIEILTPVVRSLVRTVIEEAKGEFNPVKVTNNTIHEVAGIPESILKFVYRLLP